MDASMDKKPNQITPKITAFMTKLSETQKPLKRRFSATSPTEITSISKKPNIDNQAQSTSAPTKDELTTEVQPTHLSQLIEPIMKEFKSLKDTMVSQNGEISEEINRLKKVITSHKSEIINEINIKVDTNSKSILKVLDENQELGRELKELKECVNKIEMAQLSNNIIVTGIPEQPFETYEKTKQRIYDVIAEAIKNSDPTQEMCAMNTAKNIDITYCSRVGKSKPGQNRPVSVSLGCKDDKEKLMSIKTKAAPRHIYKQRISYPCKKSQRFTLPDITSSEVFTILS